MDSNSDRSRWAGFWQIFLATTRYFPRWALVTIIVVISLKVKVVDNTVVGRMLETMSFALLQWMLPSSTSAPVEIVDVSGLPYQAGPGSRGRRVTDRIALESLIATLITLRVEAIVLSIDFSPYDDGPASPDDDKLLMKWKGLAERGRSDSGTAVKLIVGVNRTRFAESPSGWLHNEKLQSLAACAAIKAAAPRYYVSFHIEASQREAVLPGLARSVSRDSNRGEAVNEILTEQNHFDEGYLSDERVTVEPSKDGRVPKAYLVSRLVDFRPLESIRASALKFTDSAQLLANAGKYVGKIVVVGSLEDSTEHFVLPLISDRSIPGVLFHACACATEVNAESSNRRLREFTGKAKVAIDVGISLFAFLVTGTLFLAFDYYAYRRKKGSGRTFLFRHHALANHIRLDLVFGCLVLLTAWGLLQYRILWTDFLFVTMAIMLHSTIGVTFDIVVRMFAVLIPGTFLETAQSDDAQVPDSPLMLEDRKH